jgi:outer membrane protein assembly factor BamB
MVWLWLGLLVASAGTGWRGDGSGLWADAAPPSAWDLTTASWQVPMPSSASASPVPVGDAICALSEPDLVVCVDQATGLARWQQVVRVQDVLSGEAKVTYTQNLAVAAKLEAELVEARQAHGNLLREARRASGDPTVTTALAEGSAKLDRLKVQLDAVTDQQPVLVPEVGDAAATPVTDGAVLVSLFGSGAIIAHGAGGEVRWKRWLGAASGDMRGYRGGHSASPRWVGDVIVAAHGNLRGLSASSGEILWDAGPYRDYGTPAVAEMQGVGLVFTPDGRMLAAKDGVVLAEDLGDVWYHGPHVEDDVVYYVGAVGDGPVDGIVRTSAWSLSVNDGLVAAKERWQGTLPVQERVYGSPVGLHDGLLVVTASGKLFVLSRTTGEVIRQGAIELEVPTRAYRSPVLAGGKLFVGFSGGTMVVVDPKTLATLAINTLPEGLAAPWFDGPAVFLRTDDALWRVDR